MKLFAKKSILRKAWRTFTRLFLWFFFFLLLVAPFVALALAWQDIRTPGNYYDLFGAPATYKTIAIVIICVFVPLGLYGFISMSKLIFRSIKAKKSAKSSKESPKMSKWVKLESVVVLVFVLGAFFYYTPYWYVNLGIEPEFGPYIAFHGDRGMQISWDTRESVETELYWGNSPDQVENLEAGSKFYWQDPSTALKSKHHIVVLQDLDPNQEYYYRIPSLDNEIYSFRSRPPVGSAEKVRFTILGDTQGNIFIQRSNIQRMVDRYGTDGINFSIICGDWSNDDDNLQQWAYLYDDRSYGRISHTVPWMGTPGNHESSLVDESNEPRANYKLFHQNTFQSDWEKGGNFDIGCYYSFNYSNVHFVILDNFFNKSSPLGEQQYNWLDQDLARNEGKWKFLSFHLSVYSTSEHGPVQELQERLEPLMYKHKVNAIFYGHDHIYESYRINSSSSEYPGTYAFLCAGGGGSLKDVGDVSDMGDRVWNGTTNEYGNLVNHVRHQSNPAITSLPGAQYQIYAERVHHYMSVEINGDLANFQAYRTFDDSLIQEFTEVSRI